MMVYFNWNYCDYFSIYTNIESLHYTSETTVMSIIHQERKTIIKHEPLLHPTYSCSCYPGQWFQMLAKHWWFPNVYIFFTPLLKLQTHISHYQLSISTSIFNRQAFQTEYLNWSSFPTLFLLHRSSFLLTVNLSFS